ncbi:MAG TPA: hypothetical protein VNN80_28500 [Polyangiaceae bacterium]|nr:hypothetical protein [Polyangiaceae bacterium]
MSLNFWSKKNERKIVETDVEQQRQDIGDELSDDLLGQIAGGAGKGACHTLVAE